MAPGRTASCMVESSLRNLISNSQVPISTNVLMRLSQVLVVAAASFLFTSEALSTTTDSNQAKISKVASPRRPIHRLLRAHHTPVEEEDDSEERGLPENAWTYLAKRVDDLGFDMKKAQESTSYYNSAPKEQYLKGQNSFNRLRQEYRNHGPAMIIHEN